MARCRHYDNASPTPLPSVNGGARDDDLIDGGGDRPAKKPRAEDHDCVINKLPDDVLIGIISRMPIRDAVATGAVAVRWRHLWKHVPRISLRPCHIGLPRGFEDGYATAAGALRAERLAGVASSVLRHHRGAGVDRLVLALPLSPSVHSAVLDQAVEFAASAGTQELHLSLANGEHPAGPGPPPYEFPHWRFAATGGRLRRLRLSDVSLAAAMQRSLEGLARLTRLDLTRVAVDDAGVATVLSACAALTVLDLSECRQLVYVAVAHEGLRILGVRSCGGLKSVAVASSTLLELTYTGHKVDIECRRAPAMVRLVLYVINGCPLDCVASGGGGGSAALPNLRQLLLQFPSPLHALRHGWKFERLNKIVLLFKTPWREHVASVASLLAAAPLVRELRVEAYSDLPVPSPNKQAIQWPNRCSPKKLESICIGGFSGEPELMELAYFLLMRSPAMRTLTIDTHRRHAAVPSHGSRGWRREETEDAVRCYYARGVLWTHLAPKIPSTVKFTII